MADLSPRIPAGRQVIQSYGEGRFRIAGTDHAGSVLVFPDRTLAWPVIAMDGVNLDSLLEVTRPGVRVEVLLVGTGLRMALLPADLRAALRTHGVVVDAMDTGAACRTFNVLLAEERRVAAALIAVP
jgi:uncharacterized protein